MNAVAVAPRRLFGAHATALIQVAHMRNHPLARTPCAAAAFHQLPIVLMLSANPAATLAQIHNNRILQQGGGDSRFHYTGFP